MYTTDNTRSVNDMPPNCSLKSLTFDNELLPGNLFLIVF